MGVTFNNFLGGYTPICNDCAVSLCWDISQEEYVLNEEFWEEWLCKDCISHRRNKKININYKVRNV